MPPDHLVEKSSLDFQLHPVWRQFRDANVEKEFQLYAMPLHKAGLARLLFFGSLAYLALLVNDIIMLDGLSAWLLPPLLVRAVFCLTCLVLSWRLRRDSLEHAAVTRIANLASILCLVGIHFLLWLVPEEALPLAILLSIATIGVYLLIPNTLYYALSISIANSLIFLAVAYATEAFFPRELLTLVATLIAVNIFGFIYGQDTQFNWRREFRTYVELRKLSIRDHLTNCFNRRYLHDTLMPAEIDRARRYKTSLSVVICNLDHFKAVNDTHGHQSGDRILHKCAEALMAGTRRDIDSVARYGGEEFLLLMPHTDVLSAADVAERLRAALARIVVESSLGRTVTVTASFGVSGVNFAEGQGPVNDRTLVDAADRYLREAKNGGRNSVRFGALSDTHQPGQNAASVG